MFHDGAAGNKVIAQYAGEAQPWQIAFQQHQRRLQRLKLNHHFRRYIAVVCDHKPIDFAGQRGMEAIEGLSRVVEHM